MSDRPMAHYTVRCHCGAVSARIRCHSDTLNVWDCNCSDCGMRRNVHFVIPKSELEIMNQDAYLDATTLYEWGTKTAERRFCKTCGILPWYSPRSNPEGFAITLPCATFGSQTPTIVYNTYDGQNWEKTFETSAIKEESSKAE